jgi:lipoate synthase
MYFKDFINQLEVSRKDVADSTHELIEEVTKEIYEEIPNTRVAEIIKEYHDVKITDTLIESYIELASSNIFSVDPVICELRKYNKLDRLVEGKLNYTLNDGSVVAINEATQEYLNKLLQNQKEIIEYMRESKTNFLKVLEQIGE